MRRYLICANDHLGQKKNVLWSNKRYNKYEAINEIQYLAESFIKSIIGDKEITYYNEGAKGRKYGYFIIKPLSDNNCLTVYKKYIDRGYIYSSVIVQKIVSFFLLECAQQNQIYDYNFFIELPKKDNYNKVIKQLKAKFGIFENHYEESDMSDISETSELSYDDLTDFNFS